MHHIVTVSIIVNYNQKTHLNITKSILYILLKEWELEWEDLASVSDLGYTPPQFLLLYHYLFVVFLEITHKHLHLGQGQVSLFELLHHNLYIDNYTQNFHLGIPRSIHNTGHLLELGLVRELALVLPLVFLLE